MRFLTSILFAISLVISVSAHGALRRASLVRNSIARLEALTGATHTPQFLTIRRTLLDIGKLDRRSAPIQATFLGLQFANDVVEWFNVIARRDEDDSETEARADAIAAGLFDLLDSRLVDRPLLKKLRQTLASEFPRQAWARLASGVLIRAVETNADEGVADPRLLKELQLNFLHRSNPSCRERMEQVTPST